MSDGELLLFNDIYNQTQHFGRTQFVRQIMKLQQENKKYKEVIEKAIDFIDMHMYEDYCYVGSEDRLKEILNEVK